MCTYVYHICMTHEKKHRLTQPKHILEKLIHYLSSCCMPIHWGLLAFSRWQWMKMTWSLGSRFILFLNNKKRFLLYNSVSTKPCWVLATESEKTGVSVLFRHSRTFRFYCSKMTRHNFIRQGQKTLQLLLPGPPFYS